MKAQWRLCMLLSRFPLAFSPSGYQRMRSCDGQSPSIIFCLTNVSEHFLFFRENSPFCTSHAQPASRKWIPPKCSCKWSFPVPLIVSIFLSAQSTFSPPSPSYVTQHWLLCCEDSLPHNKSHTCLWPSQWDQTHAGSDSLTNIHLQQQVTHPFSKCEEAVWCGISDIKLPELRDWRSEEEVDSEHVHVVRFQGISPDQCKGLLYGDAFTKTVYFTD